MQRAVLVGSLLFTLSGCAATTFRNKAYKNRLDLGEEKLLIMPMEFHGFSSDLQTELELITGAQLIATFGEGGVSLQPIKRGFEAAGFGDFTRALAQGVFDLASVHRSPYLAQVRGKPELSPLVASLDSFVSWAVAALKAAGAPVSGDRRFRYLLVTSVDKIAEVRGGRRVEIRVVGGIVDVQKKEIVAATWFVKTAENNKAACLAALRTLGKALLKAFRPAFLCRGARGSLQNLCGAGSGSP